MDIAEATKASKNGAVAANGGYGQIAISIAGLSWVLGALTIFFQYSFYWTFISIAGVLLGAMLYNLQN